MLNSLFFSEDLNTVNKFRTLSLYLFFHFLFLLLVILFYIRLTGFQLNLEEQLLNWDAAWYNSINKSGYWFDKNKQSNTAFFPLFSFFWRLTSLSTIGISVVNFFIWLSGIFLLKYAYRISIFWVLVLISLPSAIFFYLPYTEAFFFLFTAFMLYGYRKNNQLLMYVGLLLASVTRPAAIVFLPAIFITELVGARQIRWKEIRNLTVSTFVSVVALIIIFFIQYTQTGVFNAYGKSLQFWGLKLGLPDFPLRTWRTEDAGYFVQQLDGMALFIGVFAAVVLVRIIYLRLSKGRVEAQKDYVFAACYLAGICFSRLIFGQLMSLNRYVFASAFIIVFLNYFSDSISLINLKERLNVRNLLITLLVFWILFTYHGVLNTWINYLGVSLVSVSLLSYFQNADSTLSQVAGLLAYFVLITTQAVVYILFLKFLWIG